MDRRTVLRLAAAALVVSPLPARAARTAQGLIVHDRPRPLPALDIRDAQGAAAGLETLRGRAVLLNLWASWCMPCVAELPALDRLKPRIEPRGVAVVALSLDRAGKTAVTATFARLGLSNLAIHTDDSRRAAELLSAPVLPTTLLIDRQGSELARFVGPAEWDTATALMDALATGHPLTTEMAPPLAKLPAVAP